MWSRSVIPSKVMTDSSEQQVAAESGTAADNNGTSASATASSTSVTIERSSSGTKTTTAASVPTNVHTCGNRENPSFRRSSTSTSGVRSVESDTERNSGERGTCAPPSTNYSGESLPRSNNVAGDPTPEVTTSTPVPLENSTVQSGSDRQTDPSQPPLPPVVSSSSTAPTQTNTTTTTSSEINIDMSGNPDYHHHSASSRSSGPANNSSSSSSSSRRQRNGLFGINLDLNFDPSSWLVPSNVAGRSISSLSVLPDWVRHPASIIPNRGADNSSQSSSGLSEGARQSQQQHHRHHEHYAAGAGTASRLVSHHPAQSGAGGASWNSSNFQASSSIPSNMHHHHHHHHQLPHGAPVRTRHTMVQSMRSVDEDMDADYNPVSTIDIGATGREPHGDSHSYVIDMDSPMGGWAEDDGPSSSSHGLRGVSGSHANNPASSETGHAASTSGADGSGTNSTRVTVDIPLAGRPLLGAQGIPGGIGGAAGQGGGSGQDGNSPSMSDAATGANERTRAAEILRDAPETRAFINEISRYTTIRPFIVINFLKGVFDHGTSILAFLALIVTFSHANSMVKKEVSKQRKRNLLYLTMIVINLMACVAFIYYIFNDMELYYALVFMPTRSDLTAFWSLMWAVGVTDYVAKFGTVLVKIVVVSLPGCILPFQKRGKFYLFIEYSSQLYRSFLPVYPWLFYLVSAYEGTARMFGLLLAGIYVIFKITDSVKRFKDWLKALEKLLSNVHYGTNPTTKQLDGAGTICPICHDNFANPTRLQCSHIFCEECVATWFDRERTCPMCRAKVVDDPTYRDGSTSQYIQLF